MKIQQSENGIQLELTFAECDALYRLLVNKEDLPKSFCTEGTTESFKKSIKANKTKLKNSLIGNLDKYLKE